MFYCSETKGNRKLDYSGEGTRLYSMGLRSTRRLLDRSKCSFENDLSEQTRNAFE